MNDNILIYESPVAFELEIRLKHKTVLSKKNKDKNKNKRKHKTKQQTTKHLVVIVRNDTVSVIHWGIKNKKIISRKRTNETSFSDLKNGRIREHLGNKRYLYS